LARTMTQCDRKWMYSNIYFYVTSKLDMCRSSTQPSGSYNSQNNSHYDHSYSNWIHEAECFLKSY
jgi:hypothetical protein